ncbi:nucleotidyltransferase family protein [Thermodesulfobacteriota bacterium]
MKSIGQKILYVATPANELYGALSDGDIRKWILSEGSLDEPVKTVCNIKPVSVGEDYDRESIKKIMLDLKIESVPVVDGSNRIKNILTWDIIFRNGIRRPTGTIQIPVVIMAGGKGTRLDPFTRVLPKPLIPIGDKVVIEIIMEKFHEYGVDQFYISINHKGQLIKSYFEDTNKKDRIHYLEEDQPLGTAGSLRFLRETDHDKFMVTNCDIIIESDLSEIVEFHNEKSNHMTLVVSCRNYVIPYGVCSISNGGDLESITEKPAYDLLVNTGMYVLNKEILDLIPPGKLFHVTDLIAAAKVEGFKVGVFPIDENSWIDVGQWDEYRKAIKYLIIP